MSNILIIDDEPNVRFLIRKMLKGEGHTITEAADGTEGIKSFHENPADIILTDIYMPGKEGLETIHELKKEYPDLNIVAMSGSNRGHLETARLLGARSVLEKPFDKETLLSTLRELVSNVN